MLSPRPSLRFLTALALGFGLLVATTHAEETGGRPPRPQEPVAPFPYASEEVVIPGSADGVQLGVTITTPPGPGPFPGVVLLSGARAQDRDGTVAEHKPLLVLADHLTRQGVAVLRFDDRGVGTSGGDFATAGADDFAADALAAVSFLGDRPAVAKDRVGLIAHSQGSLVATFAAGRSDQVAFLVLLAGPGLPGLDLLQGGAGGDTEDAPLNLPEISRKLQIALAEAALQTKDPAAAVEPMRQAGAAFLEGLPPSAQEQARQVFTEPVLDQIIGLMNQPWTRFVLRYDPRSTLAELTVPTLALFGARDRLTPFDRNGPAIAAALERGDNPDGTVQAISGLNHFFQEGPAGSPGPVSDLEETLSPKALGLISTWITGRFSDAGDPSDT